MLVLLCAAAFAIHIQIIDYYSPKGDGIKISCVQFLFAGVLGLICMAIFETPDLGNILACWLPILYAGVLSCGAARKHDTAPAARLRGHLLRGDSFQLTGKTGEAAE